MNTWEVVTARSFAAAGSTFWEHLNSQSGDVLVDEYLLDVEDAAVDVELDDDTFVIIIEDDDISVSLDDIDYLIEVDDE